MRALRRVLWEALMARRPGFGRFRAQLRRHEYDPPAVAAQRAAEHLARTLRYAAEHVPHYRRLLPELGIVRDGAVDLTRYAALPPLDKQTLVDSFDDLASDELPTLRYHIKRSGGTTGEPVKLLEDDEYALCQGAVSWLFKTWTGVAPGEPYVQLWGSQRDLDRQDEKFTERLWQWLEARRMLNAFRMSTEDLRRHVAALGEFPPTLLHGYADCLHQVALFVEHEGLSVPSPRAILSAAGNLTDGMRADLERVFRAPVFNQYGSRELGGVACECDHHRGLHVCGESCFVELVRPDGTPTAPGELGRMLVTTFTSRAMPLLRYDIGDLASWSGEPCACGRGWPLLAEIGGRVSDLFWLPDGGSVSPIYLRHTVGVVLGGDWLRQYQLVQEALDQVTVRLALREPVAQPREQHAQRLVDLTRSLRTVMGESCQVSFEFVDELPPSESGKQRYAISRVLPGERAA